MMTHTFYREDGRWYVDLPHWKGTKGELQMVAGADKWVDKLSNGKGRVALQLDTKPFDDCDTLKRFLKTPIIGGAWYNTKDGHTMWLCKVTEFVFGSMPKHIYYKPLAEA